ncbi:hypothetical protein Hanom_Chr01g00028471 [Helianthus anomalus]
MPLLPSQQRYIVVFCRVPPPPSSSVVKPPPPPPPSSVAKTGAAATRSGVGHLLEIERDEREMEVLVAGVR